MLECNVVSPLESRAFTSIASIVIEGSEGELGILPGHLPIITRLVPRSRVRMETGQGTVTIRVGDRSFFRFAGSVAEIITDTIHA